jgi:hypothetical protein
LRVAGLLRVLDAGHAKGQFTRESILPSIADRGSVVFE